MMPTVEKEQSMAWMVTFDDEPSRAGLRATHTDRHLAYVRSVAHQILCSGALRAAPVGAQTGGMWIIDLPTREEAVALFEADPLFQEGLRANVRFSHWTKGVWQGKLGA
jgi:uncharacterized protein YciI